MLGQGLPRGLLRLKVLPCRLVFLLSPLVLMQALSIALALILFMTLLFAWFQVDFCISNVKKVNTGTFSIYTEGLSINYVITDRGKCTNQFMEGPYDSQKKFKTLDLKFSVRFESQISNHTSPQGDVCD